ncbi:Serine threonine- kinase ATM [Olea europaea subsp. europaea]|uniref:Serine threonine- kinase ATM n=1 Tax=Olea europaea subsp. europaea TaxID=158383 RepID=A0A8S0PLD5_OLEEU|nr:Serine threonine- kinase ATM [Olea europaea subsp. europaea]
MFFLIDQATAEVVHIDLGVAFEQGLMLKTPERIPFRLTRDIVDGMGVTGVEGVFRRCSEETLSVMRTNKEALLTIVEVFIHDPLYKWALSPLKAMQRQKVC